MDHELYVPLLRALAPGLGAIGAYRADGARDWDEPAGALPPALDAARLPHVVPQAGDAAAFPWGDLGADRLLAIRDAAGTLRAWLLCTPDDPMLPLPPASALAERLAPALKLLAVHAARAGALASRAPELDAACAAPVASTATSITAADPGLPVVAAPEPERTPLATQGAAAAASRPARVSAAAPALGAAIPAAPAIPTVSAPTPATATVPVPPSGDAVATDAVEGLVDASAVDVALDRIVADVGCEGALVYVPGCAFARVRSRTDLPAVDTDRLLELARQHLWPAIAERRRRVVLNRFGVTKDAPVEPFRMMCAPLHARGRMVGILVAFNPRTSGRFVPPDAKRLERLGLALTKLVARAFDDGTGVLTRQAFEQRMLAQLETFRHRARCVLYANVDRFHVVNGALGLAGGDAVLGEIAARLVDSGLPEHSFVGRLSGDRFVAFLENCSLAGARTWAARVQRAVEAIPAPEVGSALTISFGIAPVTEGMHPSRALAAAETACKAAKDRGRARIEIFADTDASMVQRHADLRTYRGLCAALEQGHFQLHAQPIRRLRGAAPDEFEILVRMLGEDGQVLSPDRFLSAATRYQLLDRLDQWVLLQATSMLEPHVQAGGRRARFWLNVSGQSLRDRDFTDLARSVLKGGRLPAGTVNFEITENAAIGNLAAAKRFVARLGEVGCAIKLDDFGTGLCSLTYLKELAVSGVKIDGSFVRGVLYDTRSRSLVTGVLHIAQQLQLETTAECVEAAEVCAQLAAMGVDYGQGYAYGRPVPLAGVLESLRARAPTTSSAA